MQITDIEFIKAVKEKRTIQWNNGSIFSGEVSEKDSALAQQLVTNIVNMPDREDRIKEIKNLIDSGNYHPSADEIIEAIVRRGMVDQL